MATRWASGSAGGSPSCARVAAGASVAVGGGRIARLAGTGGKRHERQDDRGAHGYSLVYFPWDKHNLPALRVGKNSVISFRRPGLSAQPRSRRQGGHDRHPPPHRRTVSSWPCSSATPMASTWRWHRWRWARHWAGTQSRKGVAPSAFFCALCFFADSDPTTGHGFGRRCGGPIAVFACGPCVSRDALLAASIFLRCLLLVARTPPRLAEGALFPSCYDLLAGEWIPAAWRTRAISVMMSGIPVG